MENVFALAMIIKNLCLLKIIIIEMIRILFRFVCDNWKTDYV